MPLQHLHLATLIPIRPLHSILLITPEYAEVDLCFHIGMRLRLDPCDRREVIELERCTKVDGLDHDVFPS